VLNANHAPQKTIPNMKSVHIKATGKIYSKGAIVLLIEIKTVLSSGGVGCNVAEGSQLVKAVNALKKNFIRPEKIIYYILVVRSLVLLNAEPTVKKIILKNPNHNAQPIMDLNSIRMLSGINLSTVASEKISNSPI